MLFALFSVAAIFAGMYFSRADYVNYTAPAHPYDYR